MENHPDHVEVGADICARAHDLALEAHRRTEELLAQLTKTQGRGFGGEERRDALGCIASAVDLLSSCRACLGGSDPTSHTEPGHRALGRPPLPHSRSAQRQQGQLKGDTQKLAEHGSESDGPPDSSQGGMGEFTKLLSFEEVEAELEPGTKLENVLAGVLQQLANPNNQGASICIPGLPPASGSQRSILASLPALSGQLKGLTPRRAALTERLLVGQLINANGPGGGNQGFAGAASTPSGAEASGTEGENGVAVGSKRAAPDDEEEPEGKKTKKGGVEEPAGSYLPDDGWEWRKYGRKQMHGQPFPRSYFKCARAGKDDCKAKKQAERCSDDPTKWRVRYIGHHNHEKPPPRPVTITIVQDTIGGATAAASAATAAADVTSPLNLPANSSAPADVRENVREGRGGGGGEEKENPLSLAGAFGSRPEQPQNLWGSPTPFPSGTRADLSCSMDTSGSDNSDSRGLGKGLALAPPKVGSFGGSMDQGKGELIQDLDNLPPLPFNVQLFLPELPNEDEGEERTQDRSPCDTEFEETSTPPTPLGDGKDSFSFDIQQGVSALEQCFPPSLLEPLPPLPGGMGEVKEENDTKSVQVNGNASAFDNAGPDDLGSEMSIMVPPRRAPTLPAPVYANSPRIVVTPRRDFPQGSNMPGLTPTFTQDSARALFSSLLQSPLTTGRLPSSTRVIFELGRMPQGNNAWPNFHSQGGFNRQ